MASTIIPGPVDEGMHAGTGKNCSKQGRGRERIGNNREGYNEVNWRWGNFADKFADTAPLHLSEF